jgi:transposase
LDVIAAWVQQCQVTTVAREATGVSWRPLDDLLASEGCQVVLVAPRQGQRAPNRPTTAVHDGQWIQRLHRLGWLTAAVRPEEPSRVWRAYQRHRAPLIEDAGRPLQRREQAREQMHVKLPAVVSDLTGLTGMSISRASVRGERDAKALAPLRDHCGKASAATITRALQGPWQSEHLCAVQPSLALYDDSHEQLRDCDRVLEAHLQGMALPEVPPLTPKRRVRRRKDNAVTCDARPRLPHGAGVALTASEGSEESTARVVLREIGTDMRPWPREKPCGSGLGLAPNPQKSGGRVKSSATRPGGNRAAQAWRLAAQHLQRSQRALGACFRRMAARRGLAKAITATADKLARLISAMRKPGMASVAQGLEASETAYRERVVRQSKRKAAALGLVVVERDVVAQPSGGNRGQPTGGGKGAATDAVSTARQASGPAGALLTQGSRAVSDHRKGWFLGRQAYTCLAWRQRASGGGSHRTVEGKDR